MLQIRVTISGLLFAALADLAAGPAAAALVPLTDVVAIEAGGGHACALTSSGGMQCWGSNYWGELGDGAPTTSRMAANYPMGLTSGVAAIGVSRAGSHSCAVMQSGAVKCWGANQSGQLGTGAITNSSAVPVDVVGLGGPAQAVALGSAHTCALMADGTVTCWGHHTAVGQGTTSPLATPIPIAGLVNVASITAASFHTCVVLTSGGAKCWGTNAGGQLGDGSLTDAPAPIDVSSLSSGVAAISAGGSRSERGFIPPPGSPRGEEFTCALTTGGGAKCWGSNMHGQLGIGTYTYQPTPFDVVGLTSGVASISTGGAAMAIPPTATGAVQGHAHACVVTATGGAKCWGSNKCGQIGAGEAGVCAMFGASTAQPTPIDVTGLTSGVAEVAAGGLFSCARMTTGEVKCWGHGYQATPVSVVSGTQPQTIVVNPAPTPIAIGSQTVIQATAGGSGNPIVFTSLTPAICTTSGNSQIHGIAQGFCTVTLDQAGNAYYDAAPQVSVTFRVGDRFAQTITFGPAPTGVVVNGVGSLQASASSGLPVTFGSNTPSICSVSGAIVTGLAIGSCTVSASQAGDESYAPAPQATQTFPVTANTGTFSLIVSRSGLGAGTITSSPAGITCGSVCAGNFVSGSVVTLTPTPDAGSSFVQWSGACTGGGACSITMSAAATVTGSFNSNTPRLSNISTRAQVLTGNHVLIGGFVIGGSANKTVAIVATGPSLANFGITNPLANPRITLRSSDQVFITSNDNWQQGPNAAQLAAAGFAPTHSLEPAILVSLAPGAYTAIVDGADGGTGVAVIGIYEVDTVTAPLINISTRGQVLTGNDVMIGGFVVDGTAPQTVAIVATGPSLAAFGITNPLPNPTISLVRSSDQVVIDSNDDWQGHANAGLLQAAGFAPSNPLESGIYTTLPPGAYTAIVSGVGGGTGVSVIGVYKVN